MKIRFKRWLDDSFHRYATNGLLLFMLLYVVAASFNYHDI